MRLEYQILIAVALDLWLGDPRWFPHPVRFIGRFAQFLEAPARAVFSNERLAGSVTAVVVLLATGVCTWGLIRLAGLLHPVAADITSMGLLYTGIAAKDLVKHSDDVRAALEGGYRNLAARSVGMICGRDTADLDDAAMVRATVESVAENMVDGVTAPLFFAAMGGPVGMLVYKAVNTLDSTFGYKHEPYTRFGWASARLDDVANFIPARITALLVPLGALILGLRAFDSARVLRRDRKKHPSPNAGYTEAAFAGALGLRLGGLSYYGGIPSHKPFLGDPIFFEGTVHISKANVLMLTTSGLALGLFLAVRAMASALLP